MARGGFLEFLIVVMASSASSSIWYVYGVVPADLSPSAAPAGLDDAPVAIERHDGSRVAALVSVLEAEQYAPAVMEQNSGDVVWLSPRAVAHDRVLTWASDRGPVVPLPMFSLFSGRAAVHAMLGERAQQLASTLDRLGTAREYSLRVYRIDRELLAAIATLSPRLEELAAAAAAASPGQRYLLERKLDAEKRNDMRDVTQRLVDEITTALAAHAIDQRRDPIPRLREGEAATRGVMVLNGSFLVEMGGLGAFQQALTELVGAHAEHGLRFDFTGPWPPYHFVGENEHGR